MHNQPDENGRTLFLLPMGCGRVASRRALSTRQHEGHANFFVSVSLRLFAFLAANRVRAFRPYLAALLRLNSSAADREFLMTTIAPPATATMSATRAISNIVSKSCLLSRSNSRTTAIASAPGINAQITKNIARPLKDRASLLLDVVFTNSYGNLRDITLLPITLSSTPLPHIFHLFTGVCAFCGPRNDGRLRGIGPGGRAERPMNLVLLLLLFFGGGHLRSHLPDIFGRQENCHDGRGLHVEKIHGASAGFQ